MQPRHFLVDTLIHIPPAHALAALDAADAERTVTGAPHSIAAIVAHLTFWQEWFLQRAVGAAAPMPASAAGGWPQVTAGSWPHWHARFLAGLERACTLEGQPDRAVGPAIEFPPLATYTIRDVAQHVAQHNAHHLGQVILLRQMMGLWPPPSGSWTW